MSPSLTTLPTTAPINRFFSRGADFAARHPATNPVLPSSSSFPTPLSPPDCQHHMVHEAVYPGSLVYRGNQTTLHSAPEQPISHLNPEASAFTPRGPPGIIITPRGPPGNITPRGSPGNTIAGVPPHDTSVELSDSTPDVDIPEDISLYNDHPGGGSPLPCPCHNKPIGSCSKFITDHINLVSQASSFTRGSTILPNRDGARISLDNAQLKPEAWKSALGSYFDANNLAESYQFGWDLSFLPNPMPRDSKRNHPSALKKEADVEHYINQELAYGSIVGPIPDDVPFRTFASPLGLVPKQNSAIGRTITDCSQRGAGINTWIPPRWHRGEYFEMRLPTINHIIAAVHRCREKHPGKKILLFKVDLARYYRNFLVDPTQTPFLVIEWKGKRYMDRSLSFGNRGSMLCAQRSSNALAWIYRTQVPPSPGIPNSGASCSHPTDCSCGDNELCPYVDDLVGVSPEDQANHLFNSLLDIVQDVGLMPSQTPGHIVTPTDVCIVLGFLLDLRDNTIAIPCEKLKSIITLLIQWSTKTSATKRQIQSLTGKILFCSKVIRSGRLHLNRMLRTQSKAISLDIPISLDHDFQADVRWWLDNCSSWNGISFMEFRPAGEISVDAARTGIDGLASIGGYNHMSNQFFKSVVPPEMQSWHISSLELLAILVAARLWHDQWVGLEITGLTDSSAAHNFLSYGKSKIDLRLVMGRTFSTMEHRWKFLWRSKWLSTTDNILADCASRWSSSSARRKFWSRCSELGVEPVETLVSPDMFNYLSF